MRNWATAMFHPHAEWSALRCRAEPRRTRIAISSSRSFAALEAAAFCCSSSPGRSVAALGAEASDSRSEIQRRTYLRQICDTTKGADEGRELWIVSNLYLGTARESARGRIARQRKRQRKRQRQRQRKWGQSTLTCFASHSTCGSADHPHQTSSWALSRESTPPQSATAWAFG